MHRVSTSVNSSPSLTVYFLLHNQSHQQLNRKRDLKSSDLSAPLLISNTNPVKVDMGTQVKARSDLSIPYLVLLLYVVTNYGGAVWIEVPSTGTKCVSEDIKQNVVVIADFSVVNDDIHPHTSPNIAARVTSPYGNNLYHQENVTHGQFAFTTTEAGNYLACFWVDENHKATTGVSVSLDWRTGIAAKDWETVARKEKLEGVELELRKLEGAIDAIHQNLIYLKSREADMREVSEITNGRVAWYSIMSIGVCIAVSVMQVFHLKRYFRKKKLI